jgi:hypothetical protein
MLRVVTVVYKIKVYGFVTGSVVIVEEVCAWLWLFGY